MIVRETVNRRFENIRVKYFSEINFSLHHLLLSPYLIVLTFTPEVESLRVVDPI